MSKATRNGIAGIFAPLFALSLLLAPALLMGGSSGASHAGALGSSVATAEIEDDAVTLDKMAHGTAGNLITYSAAGAPAAVATGTATHILTSNGAGAAPTFQAPAAAGIGGSTGSTDNAILRADGTGGATAQASGVTISDTGVVSAPGLVVDTDALVVDSALNRVSVNRTDAPHTFNVTGTSLVSGSSYFGSDGAVAPSAGAQLSLQSYWGLQLVGNKQGSVGTHPGDTGARDDASVVIPNQQAAKVGLIVKGAASQSGDLAAFQNSSGTVLARVTSDGWSRWPGEAYLAANGTNATSTMASTGLSVTVTSGRKYSFKLVLYIANSLAADGAKVDFEGGSATATNFRAHGTVFDTALLLSSQTSALATDFAAATVTGDAMVEIHGTFEPSGTGTFIPRYAMNSAVSGTLTIYRGSHLLMWDMP